MKPWTLACLAAAALLAACSSDKDASSATGAGSTGADATGGYGAGGPGGAGGMGGAGGSGATPGSQEDLVRTAGDRIFFDTDRSTLNSQALATLDKQVAWLRTNPQVSVWVAGNCDERGTEEYNLALGQRRASADRDYLVAHGVDRGRIETISYGKSRPINPASTPEAWAQNRNAITSVK
ncbi:MAG: peptidoglycan-associated lipoprotein Pal [Acetobacteraceae bacterium]|nr:peptidoglycan-associated lipoprotein Pal [Pseudomonadota bacterium]